jgi:hypothetical protein
LNSKKIRRLAAVTVPRIQRTALLIDIIFVVLPSVSKNVFSIWPTLAGPTDNVPETIENDAAILSADRYLANKCFLAKNYEVWREGGTPYRAMKGLTEMIDIRKTALKC